MLKKSFTIIIIQAFGAALGLITVYFSAGDMAPEVYSLVGVYNIITSIVLTFSDLGIETTMMREALYWVKQGDEERVKEHTTQALLSRFMAFIILLPILGGYLGYLNIAKYNGQYTALLITFLIGGGIGGLNNAMSLIVRSQGGYVFSQFVSTLNNYVIKFVGLGLYFSMGQTVYLFFYGLSSIPLLIVYLIKIRKYISFEYINVKEAFKKIIKARYLWLKTDLDYLKNNADSILVSALFPASIMGSYSIFKTLEQLSKNIIEGFFDVQSQNTVKHKGNEKKLLEYEKKIKKMQSAFIVLIILGMGIFLLDADFWINLVHLNKYEGIKIMIITIGIISILHLIGKYEINALAFFASSKLNFWMGVGIFAATLFSFLWAFMFRNIEGMMLQRITVYAVQSFVAIGLFKKGKKIYYTQVLG